ncbi:MAG: hypothetical protein N3D11_07995 [Candidatus Sumerlaeia bacterium]|nr:hypothetical protein [Candidatus Sumerlaeia bacterium]
MNLYSLRIAALALAAALLLPSAACRRRSTAEREMMNRLAGTWTWKQPKTGRAAVIELTLTARGTYEQKDYLEIGGIRKLLWIRANPVDSVPEPDTPEEIAKLKRERYEPSVVTGRYKLALDRTPPVIIFESDKVTSMDKTVGRTQKEHPFTLESDNRLTLGGRTYQR